MAIVLPSHTTQLKPARWNVQASKTAHPELWRDLAVIVPVWPGEEPVAYTSKGPFYNTNATTGQQAPSPWGSAWQVAGAGSDHVSFGPDPIFDIDRDKSATVLWAVWNEDTTTGSVWWALTGAKITYSKPVTATSVEYYVKGRVGSSSATGLPSLTVAGSKQTFVETVTGYNEKDLHWNVDGQVGRFDGTITNAIYAAESVALKLGADYNGVNRRDGRYAVWAKWDRVLSDAEISLILTDPFTLIRPARQVLQVTAGGSTALTGTLFTNTATFYTGTVNVTAKTELTGTLFTNTAIFYAGTVAQSGETLLLFFQQMIGV